MAKLSLRKNLRMMMIIRNLSLLVLLLSTLASAMGPTISTFTDEEEGEANSHIVGEFTDDLTKANIGDLREGRYIMRQRFEDPFDSESVLYQLFSGKAGPSAGDLKAFEAGDLPYKLMARKKFYTSESPELDEDLEMIFFDGKYLYADAEVVFISHQSSFISLKSVTNELKKGMTPPAAIPVVAPQLAVITPVDEDPSFSDQPESDPPSSDTLTDAPVESPFDTPSEETANAYGTEDEDEDEDEDAFDDPYEKSIEEASAEVEEQNSYDQAAADENLDAVYDRFGHGDDIQEYIGYGFITMAGGFAVATLLKHMKIKEAEDVTTELELQYQDNVGIQLISYPETDDPLHYYDNTENARILTSYIKQSKAETDTRKSSRNLLGVGAILTGGIGAVLLTIDF